MASQSVYLSLGSNLGDREKHLTAAMEALERHGVKVCARSSIYETEPQEITDQPWFLNLVIRAETVLSPLELLAILHRIERQMGRNRELEQRRGPRIIDLDILLFGNSIVHTPQLTIPHGAMLQRRFVMEPLLEIAPDLTDPVDGEFLRIKAGKELAGQIVLKYIEERRQPGPPPLSESKS